MFTKHTMNLLGCQNVKTGSFLLLYCSIMYFPLLTPPSAYGHRGGNGGSAKHMLPAPQTWQHLSATDTRTVSTAA